VFALSHCDYKIPLDESGTSHLSLNLWWQMDYSSLISCLHQQLRSSPILQFSDDEIIVVILVGSNFHKLLNKKMVE
ncbi:hypothetical protein CICLE_v10033558mg, partial [Citrus x clementina]